MDINKNSNPSCLKKWNDKDQVKNLCSTVYKEQFLPELNSRLQLMRISLYRMNQGSGEVKKDRLVSPLKTDKSMSSKYLPTSARALPDRLHPITDEEIEIHRGERTHPYASFLDDDPAAVYYFVLNSSPLLAQFSEAKVGSKELLGVLNKFTALSPKENKFKNDDFQNHTAFVIKAIKEMSKEEDQKLACQIAEAYRLDFVATIEAIKGFSIGAALALSGRGAIGATSIKEGAKNILLKSLTYPMAPLGAITLNNALEAFKLEQACLGKIQDPDLKVQIPTLCNMQKTKEAISGVEDFAIYGAMTVLTLGRGAKVKVFVPQSK
jgi:hypothetical protein